MTCVLIIAATWLSLTWLAYRQERSELELRYRVEKAYAVDSKMREVAAVEGEWRRRYDTKDGMKGMS